MRTPSGNRASSSPRASLALGTWVLTLIALTGAARAAPGLGGETEFIRYGVVWFASGALSGPAMTLDKHMFGTTAKVNGVPLLEVTYDLAWGRSEESYRANTLELISGPSAGTVDAQTLVLNAMKDFVDSIESTTTNATAWGSFVATGKEKYGPDKLIKIVRLNDVVDTYRTKIGHRGSTYAPFLLKANPVGSQVYIVVSTDTGHARGSGQGNFDLRFDSYGAGKLSADCGDHDAPDACAKYASEVSGISDWLDSQAQLRAFKTDAQMKAFFVYLRMTWWLRGKLVELGITDTSKVKNAWGNLPKITVAEWYGKLGGTQKGAVESWIGASSLDALKTALCGTYAQCKGAIDEGVKTRRGTSSPAVYDYPKEKILGPHTSAERPIKAIKVDGKDGAVFESRKAPLVIKTPFDLTFTEGVSSAPGTWAWSSEALTNAVRALTDVNADP